MGLGVPDQHPGDGRPGRRRAGAATRTPQPRTGAVGSAERRPVHGRHAGRRLRDQGGHRGRRTWHPDRCGAGRTARRRRVDAVRAPPAAPARPADRRPVVPPPRVHRRRGSQSPLGAWAFGSGVLPVAVLPAGPRLRSTPGRPGRTARGGDRHGVRCAGRDRCALRVAPTGPHRRTDAGRGGDGHADGVPAADLTDLVPAAGHHAVRRRGRTRPGLHRRQRRHPGQRPTAPGRLGGGGLRDRLRARHGARHRHLGIGPDRGVPHGVGSAQPARRDRHAGQGFAAQRDPRRAVATGRAGRAAARSGTGGLHPRPGRRVRSRCGAAALRRSRGLVAAAHTPGVTRRHRGRRADGSRRAWRSQRRRRR